MKQFLLLQSRPETAASDNEYDSFLRATGLTTEQLARIRAESETLPAISLDDYSGIIFGGGPFNASDSNDKKSTIQKRVESEFGQLLTQAVEEDFPVFGACYGIGLIGAHQGGVISRKYGELPGPITVALTDAGQQDPLFEGMPREFEAIVGHKEACEVPPPNATILATSRVCPIQTFRIKNNIYATQFHPELDIESLRVRLNVYKHAGYFPPEEVEPIMERAATADLSHVSQLLRNFVRRYQK